MQVQKMSTYVVQDRVGFVVVEPDVGHTLLLSGYIGSDDKIKVSIEMLQELLKLAEDLKQQQEIDA